MQPEELRSHLAERYGFRAHALYILDQDVILLRPSAAPPITADWRARSPTACARSRPSSTPAPAVKLRRMLGRMSPGRKFMAVGAAAAVSATLAACGGGSGSGAKLPSALDPANMVPATAVAYADVVIKPHGGVRSDLIEAVNSIAGSGTAQKLDAKLDKSLGRKWSQFQIWAGQRVGVALTAIPGQLTAGHALTNDVVLVIPTNNPSAARTFLRKNIRQPFESWKLVGHYAIFGGTNAVDAAAATAAKSSLLTDPGFKSDMGQLGNGELFRAYLPLHELYEQLLPLLSKLPQYSGTSALSQGARQAPPGSSVALGMSALHNQFRMDVVEHGVPHTNTPVSGVASDVSALPASSWLAITLGGALTKAGTVGKLAANVSKSISTLQATQGVTGRIPSGPLQFIVKDLLPALGPAELSVSGSSATTLQAGLVMAPVNKSAGARLARAVKHLVNGLPIAASTSGGRVAVTFGFNSLQQLLNPSSKLAGNPNFKHALAQLPSGAKADIYLNFAGVATLAALDPSASSASTMRVLHRLNYLIAGGTHSHFRLVLATY